MQVRSITAGVLTLIILTIGSNMTLTGRKRINLSLLKLKGQELDLPSLQKMSIKRLMSSDNILQQLIVNQLCSNQTEIKIQSYNKNKHMKWWSSRYSTKNTQKNKRSNKNQLRKWLKWNNNKTTKLLNSNLIQKRKM